MIKSIHALYKMKVKTDELVAEKEAKEVSEAMFSCFADYRNVARRK